jgi:hypothetical protein
VSRELNDAFEGPQFSLAPRLASTMMMMYITLMFGAGIPLMFFIASVDLFLTYWTDKLFCKPTRSCTLDADCVVCSRSVLRLAKQPPAYDQEVVLRAIRWLAGAIIIHLFFSFFFYGAQRSVFLQGVDSHSCSESEGVSNGRIHLNRAGSQAVSSRFCLLAPGVMWPESPPFRCGWHPLTIDDV